MKKIEHIGIAVKNLDASNTLYKKLLGVSHYKIEDVTTEGVKTSFFKVGESKLNCFKPQTQIALFPNL